MLHVVHGAQTGIRLCTAKTGIRLKLPDKQQHSASLCPVMDIPLPGGRGFGGGALALPVEQTFVDGIILVHGGRGVVFIRLVQSRIKQLQHPPLCRRQGSGCCFV